MKAVIARLGSRVPELMDVAEPNPPVGDELLCRTVELGICGTDRDILASGQPWVPENSDYLVLGHECLAQVEQVGERVQRLKPGDWVVPVVRRPLDPAVLRADLLPPGQYIERGIFSAHGFGCSHFVDREDYLLQVPETIRSWAVLTEPVSITEKAVNEALLLRAGRSSGEEPGDTFRPRVLVTGQGPIAFAGILSARSRGWSCTMLGRDKPDTFRAELAAKLGAHYGCWSDWHVPFGEFNPEAETRGFDLILECTGDEHAMLAAAPWLRAMGIMVWLGAPWEPREQRNGLSALMRDAILRNQIFLGTVNAAVRDFRSAFDCLAWLAQQPIATADLLTQRVALEESLDLYRTRPPQSIKSVVAF